MTECADKYSSNVSGCMSTGAPDFDRRSAKLYRDALARADLDNVAEICERPYSSRAMTITRWTPGPTSVGKGARQMCDDFDGSTQGFSLRLSRV